MEPIKCIIQVTVPEKEQYFMMATYPGSGRELYRAIENLLTAIEYSAVFVIRHEYDALGAELRSEVMTEQKLGPLEEK